MTPGGCGNPPGKKVSNWLITYTKLIGFKALCTHPEAVLTKKLEYLPKFLSTGHACMSQIQSDQFHLSVPF